jgi:hypothetical protein
VAFNQVFPLDPLVTMRPTFAAAVPAPPDHSI